MARGRMVDGKLINSRKVNAVSEGAELLWIRLLIITDDLGRYYADPLIIKGTAMTLRDIAIESLESRLSELAEIGLINIYRSDGEKYLEIVKFESYQSFRADRERHPKFPDPDDYIFKDGCQVADNGRQMTDNDAPNLIKGNLIKPKGIQEKVIYRATTGELLNEIEPSDPETALSACRENDLNLIIEDIDDEFEQLWKIFPGDSSSKGNKIEAKGLYRGLRKKIYADVIEAGFRGYYDLLKHKKIYENFTQRPMNVARFLRKYNWLVNICFKFKAQL